MNKFVPKAELVMKGKIMGKQAMEHEKLRNLKELCVESEVINNRYATQHEGEYKFIQFQNEDQVELYEQKACDNKDNNTWMSWICCKDKFKVFPCWIVCKYIRHDYNGDYTAIYFTFDEFVSDLEDLLNVVSELKEIK